MASMAEITHITTLQLERVVSLKSFWLIIAFLFLIFAFATPYEFDYTVRVPKVEDMVATAEEGTLGRKLALPFLGLFGIAVIAGKNRRRLALNGVLGVAFYFYIGLAMCSLAWAEDTVLSLRKVVVLGLIIIGALGVGAKFSMSEILLYVVSTCGGVMALALGTELYQDTFLVPTQYSVYQFSGIMHPNALSCYVSCFILASLASIPKDKKRQWLYLLFILIGFGFLSLSKSRTSFASTVIVGLIIWLPTTNIKRKFVAFLALGIIACSLGLFFQDKLADKIRSTVLMGREEEGKADTLTNRVPLWNECLEYFEQRPWLGYGYDSFWTPHRVFLISQHQGWEIPHSHNGYIEMLLSLGLVGFALYLTVVIVFCKHAIVHFRVTRDSAHLYALGMIVWLCLEMMLEKVYMNPVFPSFVCNLMLARYAFVKDGEYSLVVTTTLENSAAEEVLAEC